MKETIAKKLILQSKKKVNYINWRFVLIYSFVLFTLFFLIGRITWLQIITPDILVHQSDMRSLRTQEILTYRGMITDRYGRPLAISVPVKAIWLDPKKLYEAGGMISNRRWKALASAIKIPFNKLIKNINANQEEHFVYLARQVNSDVANYIKNLKLPGIYLREESRRYYPSREVTAHLIGFTNVDSQGIEGIEKSFDKWLTGESSERIFRKDRNGHVIENISLIKGQEAHNLALSIDERLQVIVYRELSNAVISNKAKSGSTVLLDIKTGEVLAMANSPSYNPNDFINVKKDVIRNRAITDLFEPGSTVKPMVVMTALQQGIVKKNSVLNTIPYRIKNYEIKDITCYKKLTLTEILQKSSNVGASKLALSMPSSALVDTYSRFGLGKATNLGLVGEQNGLYPKKHQWSDIEKATFSFGYGLMVTPLQLARVYATIGSYGIYRPLSITKVNLPVPSKRVFPEFIVRTVLHMMESVALPGGSGMKAAIKDYRIAIKTGTAKKVGPNGHYINKYVAYTAGVAPASNPRFALVVVIDDPKAGKYYGGTVSAPVFSSIMSSVLRIMNIEPDLLKKTESTLIIN